MILLIFDNRVNAAQGREGFDSLKLGDEFPRRHSEHQPPHLDRVGRDVHSELLCDPGDFPKRVAVVSVLNIVEQDTVRIIPDSSPYRLEAFGEGGVCES